MINNAIVQVYNNSMILAENNKQLNDEQKSIIIDAIGALLQAVNIADFQGVYSIEQLKKDIKGLE